MSDRDFEVIGGEPIYEGKVLSLRVEEVRFADGTTAKREIVRTTGAVAVVAVDDEHLWLVRQPRESIGDPDSLELPAGRLDVPGESPLAAARRELAEEIGKASERWSPLTVYRSSSGFTDEAVHVFLAEGVTDAPGEHDSGEDERIEIVPWPLADLDRLIAETEDAKTLVGALLYARRRG